MRSIQCIFKMPFLKRNAFVTSWAVIDRIHGGSHAIHDNVIQLGVAESFLSIYFNYVHDHRPEFIGATFPDETDETCCFLRLPISKNKSRIDPSNGRSIIDVRKPISLVSSVGHHRD